MTRHLILAVSIAMPLRICAQAPAFEVTSVKFNKLPPRERLRDVGCSPGGRFVSLGQDLRVAFFWAFSLRPFQVTGLPSWIDAPDAVFDIEAKAAGPVSEDQCRLMAQTLLADRFKLTFHRAMQDLPAYALVVAKNGRKMRRVNLDDKPKPGGGVRLMGNPQPGDGGEPPRGWSMEQLVTFLSFQPTLDNRPVVDRTELQGIYEIDLDYALFPAMVDKPAILDAVQEQLGLRLESVKVPFETLRVDRFEKPDAN